MERHVVTSFLNKEDYFLLLKRSGTVSSYRGKWAGISGSIEEGESVLEAAYREISEETGIVPAQLEHLCDGEVFSIPYTGFYWVVHPLLFRSDTFQVVLSWENQGHGWFKREEMAALDTVPNLIDALDDLLEKYRQKDHI